jgi:hypothetical protein
MLEQARLEDISGLELGRRSIAAITRDDEPSGDGTRRAGSGIVNMWASGHVGSPTLALFLAACDELAKSIHANPYWILTGDGNPYGMKPDALPLELQRVLIGAGNTANPQLIAAVSAFYWQHVAKARKVRDLRSEEWAEIVSHFERDLSHAEGFALDSLKKIQDARELALFRARNPKVTRPDGTRKPKP